MSFFVEIEKRGELDFDVEEVLRQVGERVLETEKCPYQTQVNLLLTDNESIREINRVYRQTDRETDVLSFPGLSFAEPGVFEIPPEDEAGCFDPETGELVLGDIVISADKVAEQAESYGHSRRREFAFLVAHSMLHLCGYDHMEPLQAKVMEEKQSRVLEELGITRDAEG